MKMVCLVNRLSPLVVDLPVMCLHRAVSVHGLTQQRCDGKPL